MARQARKVAVVDEPRKIVDFRFADRDYKIDLASNRVYRNWVSVEAAQSITILTAYRHETPFGS